MWQSSGKKELKLQWRIDMIFFFNRKELLITSDFREVNQVQELLRDNRIGYQVKIVNSPVGAGRNRVSFSRRQEQQIVYVHKQDWEYAMYLLRNR